jgi:hypothetical protein
MQVYRGTFETTSGTGTKTVTLDTPVPVGKSYPRITWTAPGTVGSYGRQPAVMLTDEVDGHYTKLTFEWLNTSTGDITINWEVITGDELTVQSGREVFNQSKAVAITAVDLDESYIVVSTSADSSRSYATYVDAGYTATDEITLTRRPIGGNVLVCWYSVTMAGATVQSGSNTIAGAPNATATIDEVDLTKSFLQFSFSTAYYTAGQLLLEGHFNSATQIEFKFDLSLGSAPTYVKWFVVTHPKLKVQYGQTTMASGNANPINETIDAIKLDRAFGVISTRNTSTHDDRDGYGKVLLGLSTNYATLQRLQTIETTTASWFVVEWVAAPPATNLRPDTSVIPDEPNTFTWKLQNGIQQTAHEIEYREVGEEIWQTTGIIQSTVSRHVIPADTFEVGKDYEWRVRYWALGEDDPSDYSAIVRFDTYNPVIQNPVPYPDSSVRVDIRDFGGRLKSPYGRDIQLTIEIAPNPDFTNPVIYTLPPVESGEEAIIQHAIQEGGTWYVRMTATDTENLQTVLAYSFFAGQFIQFIDMPTIQLEPQQATHVTVKVRGTSTEYTAVVDPVPPPDKAVERLFYIQAGDQSTCQKVAEAFLAKLGRPQVRVSGVIPLTVTLKFGQKVKVVIPEAGINEEMVLQRKEHRINEREAATYVVLGDIIVSDNELLARILERGI